MRLSLLLLMLTTASAWSQTLVFRESFGFGQNYERPKSGKGRLEPSRGGLSGFWAELPSNKNTTWMTLDGSGSAGWRWASSSPNPYQEPSPLEVPAENGLAWCSCEPGPQTALLAPMSSPRQKFLVSGDLLPNPVLGHYTSLGVTNSNVLQGNFESGAAVWVRLRMDVAGDSTYGLAELRTRGTAGPSASQRLPIIYNGFNHVEITIDPVALQVTARVNGIVIGTVPAPTGTTRYVGFEGSGGVDNLVVKLVP